MLIISLILLQIFIFAGLAFFLRHLLGRNVTSATSHLQGMIKDNAEKQEEIQKKLEASQKEYEETISRAKKEAQDIKEKSDQEAAEARDKILFQANLESEKIIEQAHKTCETIKADLRKHIHERAIELAGPLTCKVLPQNVRRSMHEEWLEALIKDGFSGLERLRVPDEVTTVEVATAFDLTEEQRGQLRANLKERLDRDVNVEERVDAELVAGIVLTLGNLIFDGSFANKMKEVMQEHAPTEK